LLSRFITSGAAVAHGDWSGGADAAHRRVFGVAVTNPDGSRAMAVVNDSEVWGDFQVSVAGAPDGTLFYRYRVDLANRDDPHAEVQPEGPFGADFTDPLPPMSFTVYATAHRRHDESAPAIGKEHTR
jgi:hypothetical protein